MIFDLPPLFDAIRLATLDVAGKEPDPELLGARLADGLADAGRPVPSAGEWAKATKGFDTEAWSRLAILVRLFRESPVAGPIAASLAERDAGMEVFTEFCSVSARLLTVELLQKSSFRMEELARKWVHALGGGIAGESAEDTAQQLARLDFGGVMKNLQAADADRARRMKKLQEIEAKRLKAQQEAYERAGRE